MASSPLSLPSLSVSSQISFQKNIPALKTRFSLPLPWTGNARFRNQLQTLPPELDRLQRGVFRTPGRWAARDTALPGRCREPGQELPGVWRFSTPGLRPVLPHQPGDLGQDTFPPKAPALGHHRHRYHQTVYLRRLFLGSSQFTSPYSSS